MIDTINWVRFFPDAAENLANGGLGASGRKTPNDVVVRYSYVKSAYEQDAQEFFEWLEGKDPTISEMAGWLVARGYMIELNFPTQRELLKIAVRESGAGL